MMNNKMGEIEDGILIIAIDSTVDNARNGGKNFKRDLWYTCDQRCVKV